MFQAIINAILGVIILAITMPFIIMGVALYGGTAYVIYRTILSVMG